MKGEPFIFLLSGFFFFFLSHFFGLRWSSSSEPVGHFDVFERKIVKGLQLSRGSFKNQVQSRLQGLFLWRKSRIFDADLLKDLSQI